MNDLETVKFGLMISAAIIASVFAAFAVYYKLSGIFSRNKMPSK